MAFLKSIGAIVIGGGIGYALFQFAVTDESDLKKHLPPYSSEKHSLFRPRYKQSAKLMNQEERPRAGLRDFETQNSVNDTKK